MHYSCIDPRDDHLKACFGCENAASSRSSFYASSSFQTHYDHYGTFYPNGYQDYYINLIDRQSGERFKATRQSRRIICRRDPAGVRRCKLRVDRSMQMRQITYGRAIKFIQSEEYLSDEDLNIIR